jgi:hypothetical protein
MNFCGSFQLSPDLFCSLLSTLGPLIIISIFPKYKPGLQVEGVLAYFTHLKCRKRIGYCRRSYWDL